MGQEISAVVNSAGLTLSRLQAPSVSLDKVLARARSACSAAVTASRFHSISSGRSLEDDYELENNLVLGKGTGTNVVLARGRKNLQKYAVKTLQMGPRGDSHDDHWEELQMKAAEVEIFLMLDHPNIVRLHDVYDGDHGQMHLVMECCTGGELFYRVVDKGPLPEHEAAVALGQMLRAVGYLHANGIVHRDLKPENFLYESKKADAPLKMIDFGFGEVWNPTTLMRQCCGTLSYVSPEVLLMEGYTDKCDMWSLGIIAFVLLMGYPPFRGEDADLKLKIKAGEVDRQLSKYSTWRRWSALPEDAQDLVKALLVKDPVERLSAQKAIFHPWLIREQATGMGAPVLDDKVFQSLRRYGNMQPLQRAVVQLIVQQLRPSVTLEATKTFLALDVENTGTISVRDLKDALCRNHRQPQDGSTDAPADDVEQLCDMLDAVWDEQGISYSEFVAACAGPEALIDAKIAQAVFHRLDACQSGLLDVPGVQEVFCGAFDEVDIGDWMSEAAAEQKEELSFADFATMFGLSC